MKHRRIFDILGAFAFLILLGFFVFNHYVSPPKKKINPKLAVTKANEILRNKVKLSPSSLNTSTTSSACTFFLIKSAESSMNDYANEFIDHHVDDTLKTCNGAIPTSLQSKIDQAVEKCKSSTREKIETDCYSALIQAKTKSVATIIKAGTDPKTLDATVLLHLIADKFANGDFFETPEYGFELVDALLEKEPNYLGGYKVKLMLLAMSSLNKEERYKELYRETFEDAIRLKNDDPELLEISLAVKGDLFGDTQKENHDELKKDFMKYLKEQMLLHPQSSLYDYYLANSTYDGGKGDYEQTVKLLERARLKNPNDSRLKQTLENLKSDDETKRNHPFTLSIGFSLNDL